MHLQQLALHVAYCSLRAVSHTGHIGIVQIPILQSTLLSTGAPLCTILEREQLFLAPLLPDPELEQLLFTVCRHTVRIHARGALLQW
jgi:hypothetical protein